MAISALTSVVGIPAMPNPPIRIVAPSLLLDHTDDVLGASGGEALPADSPASVSS